MTVLKIHIDNTTQKWRGSFPRQREKMEQAAACAFLAAKKPASLTRLDAEVFILLTTDARVKTLNRTWRGQDKPTNVLSFPQYDPALLRRHPAGIPVHLGDVVLAYDTVARESRLQGKTLEAHTIHLIVHGILHILGYDHMQPAPARRMEKLECDILATLGYPDPYADDTDENGNTHHGS